MTIDYQMRKQQWVYNISTGLISMQMLASAYMIADLPMMQQSLDHLGFPRYFQWELVVIKILGVLAIALPSISTRWKERAYFGFFILFVSGIYAHIALGDPASVWGGGLIALIILSISYVSFKKINNLK